MCRRFEGFAQRIELARHQHTRTGQRCGLRHGFGGRLRTMSRAERIVYKHIAQSRISFAQFEIVFLLAFVDAHVLQHGHVTGFERRLLLAPIVEHAHFFAQKLTQMGGHGRNIVFRLELALGGAAQMRHHNHRCAIVQTILNGSQRSADAGVVTDGTVFKRHVHIGTDQYGFALHVLIGEFQKSHVGVLVGE